MIRISQLRAFALTILALTVVGTADIAFARTAYDGDWTVLLATKSGPCGSSHRFGLQIVNGTVGYDGGMVTTRGRVTPKGALRVIVQSGGQSANGSGRLTKAHGAGVWSGRTANGPCAGDWVAEHR